MTDLVETDARRIADWLSQVLAEAVQLDPESIRSDVPLQEYGMDSLISAMLLAEIEDGLEVLLDPAELPTVMSLDELATIVVAHGAAPGYLTREDADVA
jgi:acyl carrier protein